MHERLPATHLMCVAALVFGASGTLACRTKCSWPEPLVEPIIAPPRSRDWSSLKIEPTDVYVSLRRCGNVGRWSRFLAIPIRPLPAEFWQEGGRVEAEVDGVPATWVMFMDDRKVIYLHGSPKQTHQLTLTLVGPDGVQIDEHTLSVGREAWKQRRYEY